MTLTEYETAIVNHLQANISEVPTEPFPEKPAEYRLKHPKGVILVSYQGSQYGDNKGGNVVIQDRKLEWELIVIYRHLREHSGAYGILDQARSAMTGFQIGGHGKIYPIRERFISENTGIWQYGITIAFHGTHKEEP